jgi:hypothetical protein
MPNPFGLPEATQPMLSEYRYEASPSEGGIAIFEWSDGTVTREVVASEAEAMMKMKAIQKNGGFKIN